MARRHTQHTLENRSRRRDGVKVQVLEQGLTIQLGVRAGQCVGARCKTQLAIDHPITQRAHGEAVDSHEDAAGGVAQGDGEVPADLGRCAAAVPRKQVGPGGDDTGAARQRCDTRVGKARRADGQGLIGHGHGRWARHADRLTQVGRPCTQRRVKTQAPPGAEWHRVGGPVRRGRPRFGGGRIRAAPPGPRRSRCPGRWPCRPARTWT